MKSRRHARKTVWIRAPLFPRYIFIWLDAATQRWLSIQSTIGVRLSDEIRKRLEELGKVRDRTPHYLMKAAIKRFLEAEEALEAERQLVKSRWEAFELTGETVDHADVKAWAANLDPSDPKSAA